MFPSLVNFNVGCSDTSASSRVKIKGKVSSRRKIEKVPKQDEFSRSMPPNDVFVLPTSVSLNNSMFSSFNAQCWDALDTKSGLESQAENFIHSLQTSLNFHESTRIIDPPSFLMLEKPAKIKPLHSQSQILPTLSLISPRSQSKIALLPALSSEDETKVNKYLQLSGLLGKMDDHKQLKSSVSRLMVQNVANKEPPSIPPKTPTPRTPISTSVSIAPPSPVVEFMPMFKEKVFDELGILLDAAFIRQLKAKRFLDRVHYSLITLPLSESFNLWKIVSSQITTQLRCSACIRIQTFVRNVLKIVHCKWKLRLIIEQRRAEVKRDYDRFVASSRAAVVIQTRWRCYQCKLAFIELLNRSKSRKILLNWLHSLVCKKWLGAFKSYYKIMNRSACLIQSHYRRILCQRRRALLIKIRESDAISKLESIKSLRTRRQIAVIGAVCRIQSMIRNHALRQNISNLIQVNRDMKASLIQHWFRSQVNLKLYKIHLKKKQEQKKKIANCAIRIQSTVRRKLAYMRFYDLGRSKRIRTIVSIKLAKLMTTNDSLPHKIRNQLVSIGRLVMPCRARWEAVHAIRIQKCWRGRHGRRRYMHIKLISNIDQRIKRQKLIESSTLKVQSFYRGFVVRREAKRRRLLKYSAVISSVFLVCHAKKKLFKLKNRVRASVVIQKYYRCWIARRNFTKLMTFAKKNSKQLKIVRNLFIDGSSRRRLRKSLAVNRIKQESVSICHYRLAECLVRINVKQVNQDVRLSLNIDELDEEKSELNQKKSKKRMKRKSLIDIKTGIFADMLKSRSMTVSDLFKQLVTIPILIRLPTRKAVSISYLSNQASNGNLVSLSKNDIDVIFAKHKSSSSSLISIQQFACMMQDVACSAVPCLESFDIHCDHFNKNGTQNKLDCLMFFLMRQVLGMDTDIHSWIKYYMLSNVQPSSTWLQEIRENNLSRVLNEANVYATKIQSLGRCWLARRVVHLLRAERDDKKAKRKLEGRIIFVQAIIRRFLSRRRLLKLSRSVIVQYYPPNKLTYKCCGMTQGKISLSTWKPYWYNKTTSQSLTNCLINKNDCKVVYLPLPEVEFAQSCSQCRRVASLACIDCESNFCKDCFDAVHLRQSWVSHRLLRLVSCFVCEYQAASIYCETCSIEYHRKHKKASKSLYCDTCYYSRHFPPHFSGKDRITLMKLSQHKTTRLVVACQLCSSFSSRWRCDVCRISFCTFCMDKTHSNKPSHKLQHISYYAVEMSKKYDKEYNLNLEALGLDKLMPEIREIFRVRNTISAIKIQSWYRGVKGRMFGRSYMKSVLHERRIRWKIHNRDAVLTRSKIWYKALSAFGCAPVLRSDTMEERVLGALPFWKKWNARYCILSNQLISSKPKSSPKIGFQAGYFDELLDQAWRGGSRLPGYGMIRLQDGVVQTSVDLRPYLENGDVIRLLDKIYTVMQTSSQQIAIDMRWRGGDRLVDGNLKKKKNKADNDERLAIRSKLRDQLKIEEEDSGNEELLVIYKMHPSFSLSARRYLEAAASDNIFTQMICQLMVDGMSRLVGTAEKKKKKSSFQRSILSYKSKLSVLLLSERPSGKTNIGELRPSEIIVRVASIWDDSSSKKNEEIHMTPQEKLINSSQGYENWEEGYDETKKCVTWTDLTSHELVTTIPDCVRARNELVMLNAEKAQKAREMKSKLESMKKRSVNKQFGRI